MTKVILGDTIRFHVAKEFALVLQDHEQKEVGVYLVSDGHQVYVPGDYSGVWNEGAGGYDISSATGESLSFQLSRGDVQGLVDIDRIKLLRIPKKRKKRSPGQG